MNSFRIEQLLSLLEEPMIQDKIKSFLLAHEQLESQEQAHSQSTEEAFTHPSGRKGFLDTEDESQNQLQQESQHELQDDSQHDSQDNGSNWEEEYHHLQEEYQKLQIRNQRLEQELTQALRQSKARLSEIGKLKGELTQRQELLDIREEQMVDLSGMLDEAQVALSLRQAVEALGDIP